MSKRKHNRRGLPHFSSLTILLVKYFLNFCFEHLGLIL